MSYGATVLLAVGVLWAICGAVSGYHAGCGIADITGPPFERGMAGFASSDQLLTGIHTRMFARAFIIADKDPAQTLTNSDDRIVYVVLDGWGPSQLLKERLISKLSWDYGNLYNEENVMIAATHSHSGAAGTSQYMMYNLMNSGFIQQTFDAFLEGTYYAIKYAHQNLEGANIYYHEGDLTGPGINRSPTSYVLNSDTANYNGDIDTVMKQLQIFSYQWGDAMGVISWYALHTTNMGNTNTLMSGDNFGYASQMMEKDVNGADVLPGNGFFVAAFAQANSGDITPNNVPPTCTSDGSSCDGSVPCPLGGLCLGKGPGSTMVESVEIQGTLLANKALDILFNLPGWEELTSGLDYRLQYMNMKHRWVTLADGSQVQTCAGSLGKTMLGGTTDGPGLSVFTQGMTKAAAASSAPFNISDLFDEDPDPEIITVLLGAINTPSASEDLCQGVKDVAISVGEMTFPYQWVPNILDTQLFQLGNFVIAGVPTEITTMAGRRVINSVLDPFIVAGQTNTKVALSTLTGVYAGYTATREEYSAMRYEASSTMYGPYQLEAFQEQYEMLASSLVNGASVPTLTPPPDLDSVQIKIVNDFAPADEVFPLFQSAGDCKTSLSGHTYYSGNTVTAKFVSADPRNNLEQSWSSKWSSFAWVEKGTYTWDWFGGYWTWDEVVATDASWETTIEWSRMLDVLGGPTNEFEATIKWTIPAGQAGGTYRIRHSGYFRSFFSYVSFNKDCGSFTVA